MKGEVLEALLAARADRRPVVRATWLEDGREALFGPGEPGLPVGLDEAVDGVLRRDEATLVETGEVATEMQTPDDIASTKMLDAIDVADAIVYALTRPDHVGGLLGELVLLLLVELAVEGVASLVRGGRGGHVGRRGEGGETRSLLAG